MRSMSHLCRMHFSWIRSTSERWRRNVDRLESVYRRTLLQLNLLDDELIALAEE